MASPLLAYANTRLRVATTGQISVVNGRPTQAPGDTFLIRCFLKEFNTAVSRQALEKCRYQQSSAV